MQLSSRNKGILFLLISSFGFALISLFVRLAGDVPTMEKTLYRNVVSALVISVVLLRSGTPFRLPRECRGDMFLRCLFGYTGMVCYLWSIDHMGLADANMLNKTSVNMALQLYLDFINLFIYILRLMGNARK